MDAHMLAEVIMSAEVLTTPGIRTLVRFFISVYTPHMPFQMFPSCKTLAAAFDVAEVHPCAFPPCILSLLACSTGRTPTHAKLKLKNGSTRIPLSTPPRNRLGHQLGRHGYSMDRWRVFLPRLLGCSQKMAP